MTNDSVELPACDAIVVMTVDGERIDRHVRLVNGLNPSTRRTEVITLQPTATASSLA